MPLEAGLTLGAMETTRTEAGFVFLLTGEEREALARILRVVEDSITSVMTWHSIGETIFAPLPTSVLVASEKTLKKVQS